MLGASNRVEIVRTVDESGLTEESRNEQVKYGPLHAVEDGIAVAPPVYLHVRATVAGLAHHRGAELLEVIMWGEITSIQLGLPSSRFPYPGTLATAGYALLTFLSQQAETPEYAESTITVNLVDGEVRELAVNHTLGGYWKNAVATAELLLTRLIEQPQERAVLKHPEQVVQRYANAVRWRLRVPPL